MKRFVLLLAAVVVLWLAAQASAMSSTNYQLDWFTPLTTSGGGPVSSTNYAANFSVGQTAVSSSASSNYATALGYWPAFEASVAASYTITPAAGANGSITPGTPQMVNAGASQAFAITANASYHILDVGVDGASVGAVSHYTFTNVAANHTLTATFTQSYQVFVFLPLALR